MRVSGIESVMSTEIKEGVELPKFIRTLTIETAEEEQLLRLFLTGALKVDESGCHQLGRGFGSNALATNPDVSNGSRALGNDSSSAGLSGLLKASALDVKLQAINSLTAILNADGHFNVKNAASKKLNLLIQEL